MKIRNVIIGAAVLATLGSGAYYGIQSNKGYKGLEDFMRVVDQAEHLVENYSEPGREKYAEKFHTIIPSLDTDFFEKRTPRAAQEIEDGAGYLQLGGLGAVILGTFYTAYRKIRG